MIPKKVPSNTVSRLPATSELAARIAAIEKHCGITPPLPPIRSITEFNARLREFFKSLPENALFSCRHCEFVRNGVPDPDNRCECAFLREQRPRIEAWLDHTVEDEEDDDD